MVKTVERAELSLESVELLSAICKTFTEQFSEEGTHAAFAPGRVNLIGEHTDYNDGFVFPMVRQISDSYNIDRAGYCAPVSALEIGRASGRERG